MSKPIVGRGIRGGLEGVGGRSVSSSSDDSSYNSQADMSSTRSSINSPILSRTSVGGGSVANSMAGSINAVSSASTGLFTNLAMFSPLIIVSSVFVFSVFLSQIQKGLFYIFLVIGITVARVIAVHYFEKVGGQSQGRLKRRDPICDTGNFLPGSNNSSYSSYVLLFTMAYICSPMLVNGNMNYGVLLFFLIYIIFDITIKVKLGCVSGLFGLLGDGMMGLILGGLISGLMFTFGGKKLLFINDVASDKQVCNMPSKQTFKCAVYKNGELVGSTTSK